MTDKTCTDGLTLPARFDDLPEDTREMLAAFAEQGFEDAAGAIGLCREASRKQPPSASLLGWLLGDTGECVAGQYIGDRVPAAEDAAGDGGAA